MNWGPAWGKTIERSEKENMELRDDFFIENDVNDPATTEESKLVLELMLSTK